MVPASRVPFVVVGSDTQERPTVWLSNDGQRWSTTRLADEKGAVAVAATADGLIALSGGLFSADTARLMVWSSYDGITWAISELGEGFPSTVGVGPKVVMWEHGLDGDRNSALMWSGTPR